MGNDASLSKIMKDYNIDQMQPAKTPDGNMVVVSAYGQVADDEYLDPSTGKVLKFNHLKHVFSGETDKQQTLSPAIEGYRKAIETAMNEYNENQFKKGKCVVTVYGADDGKINICLSARNVHLSSFWTGGWRSIFTIDVSAKGKQDLKANTKVNVHYFEDGNVQLHSAIENTVSVDVSSEEATAKAIVEVVTKHESEYQSSLEEMYVDMHRVTFKAMRRFLPVTKQMMNWNVYAHSAKIGSS